MSTRFEMVECETCLWRELGIFPGPFTRDEVVNLAASHARATGEGAPQSTWHLGYRIVTTSQQGGRFDFHARQLMKRQGR